jgi:hypothetical protein
MRTFIEDRPAGYRRPLSLRPVVALAGAVATVAVAAWFMSIALREGGVLTWAGHERLRAHSAHVGALPPGLGWNVTGPMALAKGDRVVARYRVHVDQGAVAMVLTRGDFLRATAVADVRRVTESAVGELAFEVREPGIYRVETRPVGAAGAGMADGCEARIVEAARAGVALPVAGCVAYDVRADITWRLERADDWRPPWDAVRERAESLVR